MEKLWARQNNKELKKISDIEDFDIDIQGILGFSRHDTLYEEKRQPLQTIEGDGNNSIINLAHLHNEEKFCESKDKIGNCINVPIVKPIKRIPEVFDGMSSISNTIKKTTSTSLNNNSVINCSSKNVKVVDLTMLDDDDVQTSDIIINNALFVSEDKFRNENLSGSNMPIELSSEYSGISRIHGVNEQLINSRTQTRQNSDYNTDNFETVHVNLVEFESYTTAETLDEFSNNSTENSDCKSIILEQSIEVNNMNKAIGLENNLADLNPGQQESTCNFESNDSKLESPMLIKKSAAFKLNRNRKFILSDDEDDNNDSDEGDFTCGDFTNNHILTEMVTADSKITRTQMTQSNDFGNDNECNDVDSKLDSKIIDHKDRDIVEVKLSPLRAITEGTVNTPNSLFNRDNDETCRTNENSFIKSSQVFTSLRKKPFFQINDSSDDDSGILDENEVDDDSSDDKRSLSTVNSYQLKNNSIKYHQVSVHQVTVDDPISVEVQNFQTTNSSFSDYTTSESIRLASNVNPDFIYIKSKASKNNCLVMDPLLRRENLSESDKGKYSNLIHLGLEAESKNDLIAAGMHYADAITICDEDMDLHYKLTNIGKRLNVF